MGKNFKSNKKQTVKIIEEKLSDSSNGLNEEHGKRSVMLYVDIVCILVAITAVEILLGILVFKQPIYLLLAVIGLNLLLGLVSAGLHPYFLIGMTAIQLIAGGLSSRMIIATFGAVLFTAICFSIRKLLK